MAPRCGGAKSGGALRKLRPKIAVFGPKQPRNPVKLDKRRETVATLHVRLNCLLTNSSFLPSGSTICPRNGPKTAKNGLNVRYLCQTGPKPRTGRILVYEAQNRIPGELIPPATPPFLSFRSLRIAQRDAYTPVPVVTWWSPTTAQPAHREGQRWVHRGPLGRKKRFFSKLFLDHLGWSIKYFEAVWSPWWRVMGHGKSQNALKMGRFKTKNGSKMGEKRIFAKVIVDHLGCSNKCF